MTKSVTQLFGLALMLFTLTACEHMQGDPWWMGSDKVPKADAVQSAPLPSVATPQKLAPPQPQPHVVTPPAVKKEAPALTTKEKTKAKVTKPLKQKSKAKKKAHPKAKAPTKASAPKQTKAPVKKSEATPARTKASEQKLVLIEPPSELAVKGDSSETQKEINLISQKLKKPRVRSGEKETWCYRTIGRPDCYNDPQPGEAERLIAVDPPSKMPRSAAEYQERVMEAQ